MNPPQVYMCSPGDQPCVFFGRNDAKAETPVLWPPHAKSWLIGKDFDAGRDWGQEEKGLTVDEMAEWHHRLNGREFEWTLGDGDGRGGLACCDSWCLKESDMTERLNWTKLTRWTFVGKVICLLLNMLSRLVITFLPRSKRLLISWLQPPSIVIFGAPKNKVSHFLHCFPIYFPWSDGTRCHDLSFLNVEL